MLKRSLSLKYIRNVSFCNKELEWFLFSRERHLWKISVKSHTRPRRRVMDGKRFVHYKLNTSILSIWLRIGLRNEAVFTTFLLSFWGERPDPSVDGLRIQIGIDELASSNAKVVGCLRFIIVKHHKLSSMIPRVVVHVGEQLLGGFMRELLQLTLRTVKVVGRQEALIVVHHCGHLSIAAERQQISANSSIVVQVVDSGRGWRVVKDIHWCERILILQNILSWIHEGAGNEAFLAVSSDYPVPVGILFVENCWEEKENRKLFTFFKINLTLNSPVTNSPRSTDTSFSSRAMNVYSTMYRPLGSLANGK